MKKLMGWNEFCIRFSTNVTLISIIGNFFKVHDSREEYSDRLHRDYFPVITSIKMIDSNTVEIKRAVMFKRFFNTLPYPEETIVIDRSKLK